MFLDWSDWCLIIFSNLKICCGKKKVMPPQVEDLMKHILCFSDNVNMGYSETEKGKETTEGRQTVNPTNPGVQRRQPHLHALQPLSQCYDLTPELTLPLTQVLHIPPKTERSNVKCKELYESSFTIQYLKRIVSEMLITAILLICLYRDTLVICFAVMYLHIFVLSEAFA